MGWPSGSACESSGPACTAGEVVVIEKIGGSVVPAATVRTEAGRSRQVRTIDLEPVTGEG
jgi:hypothetical protein